MPWILGGAQKFIFSTRSQCISAAGTSGTTLRKTGLCEEVILNGENSNP